MKIKDYYNREIIEFNRQGDKVYLKISNQVETIINIRDLLEIATRLELEIDREYIQ